MAESKPKIKRTLTGKVVSDKMAKTLVVEVNRMKQHSVYKKRYRVTKRYHVHDAKEEYKVGDRVRFRACRPLSRTKRWHTVPKSDKKK